MPPLENWHLNDSIVGLLLEHPSLGIDHGHRSGIGNGALASGHRDSNGLSVDHHLDRHREREIVRGHPLEPEDTVRGLGLQSRQLGLANVHLEEPA